MSDIAFGASRRAFDGRGKAGRAPCAIVGRGEGCGQADGTSRAEVGAADETHPGNGARRGRPLAEVARPLYGRIGDDHGIEGRPWVQKADVGQFECIR